ncbi:MAG: spore cortex biosynthesis protein YabQ [Bacillota bacterium]
MEYLFSQIHSFSAMVVYGIFLAFSFDIYRYIIDNVKKISRHLVKVGDIIFGIFSGITGFFILLMVNWGNLRIYVFIAIFLGVLIYIVIKNKLFNR